MKGRPDRLVGPRGGAEGKANVSTDHLMLYEGNGEQRVAIEKQPSLHAEEFALFADALDEGRPVVSGLDVGRQMLAVSLAVLESVRSGRVIDFDSYFRSLSETARLR